MSKNLIKDTLRTIKVTFSKFISLVAIVALGVAFFVGVSAGAPIMSESVDKYNDEYSLMDLQIYSNLGFDEEDIDEIKKVEGVELVVGNKFVDVEGSFDNSNRIIRINGYKDNQGINDFVLKEGRLPTNATECLVEEGGLLTGGYAIGSKIKLNRPDGDLDDYLNVDELTVVGLIDTPEYVNEEKGNSTLSNRSLQTFAYIKEEAFSLDFYTSALILVEDAKSFNSFNEDYIDYVDGVTKRIETLAQTQALSRRNKLYDEAMEKYNDGLVEYNEGKLEFEEEIEKAQNKIKNAKLDLIQGEKEIKENEVKFNEETAKAQSDLDSAQYELEKGLAEWKIQSSKFETETKPSLLAQKNEIFAAVKVSNMDELNAMIGSVTANITKIKGAIDGYNARIKQIDELLLTITDEDEKAALIIEKNEIQNGILPELQGQSLLLTTGLENLEKAKNGIIQIDDGIAQGEKEIAQAKVTLDDGANKVWVGRVQLEETKVSVSQQLVDAKDELSKGRVELSDAEIELAKEKEKGQKELDDAWADLVKAKAEIDDIDKAEWTVLNRDLHYGSKTFKDTIGQMRSIATVFPVFFFLVAALVCLTTMTRMVDEQRGQIGVLRALGYGKLACSSKYLIYAFLATIFGSVIGSVVGLLVFPGVIYNAWQMMYVLPKMVLYIPWNLIFIANVLFIVAMCGTTWLVCKSSMNEVPSYLLRPKAPLMGKKILLERITVVWKKLSFTSKVTARNIVRYKKRFLMTVIGISGCTALLVAGFGIRDSISTIVDKQFVEIYQYDGFVSLSDELVMSEIKGIQNEIESMKEVEQVLPIFGYNGKVVVKGKEEVATISVYTSNDELQNMNVIRDRKTKEEVELTDDGVIINEKLAELLNVNIGDTISLESENEFMKSVTVSGICEMYVNHSIFMTTKYYQEVFSVQPSSNTLIVKLNEDTPALQQTISEIDGVESIDFYQSLIQNFNEMISGLNIITVVLIVCAGLLAFVVLSNLTNVNISERQREIATLKVLGFNRKEVNAYIYKENLLLTFVGSLFGLILGIVLHRFIILMVEMDYIMFGRNVSVQSLIISVVITMFFAVFVNFFMTFKLRKIQMVESLKSVE